MQESDHLKRNNSLDRRIGPEASFDPPESGGPDDIGSFLNLPAGLPSGRVYQ
jgi:hypothetical protein